MKTSTEHVDSDSGNAGSDIEKRIDTVEVDEHGLPPDPDAGLSEAERAAIVCAASWKKKDTISRLGS